MNSYQTQVLWLGLILVFFNVIINIGEVKKVIFAPSTGAASAATGSGGNSTSNGIMQGIAGAATGTLSASSPLPANAIPTPMQNQVTLTLWLPRPVEDLARIPWFPLRSNRDSV